MNEGEKELGRKLRSGDRNGFEEVYHAYAGRVLGCSAATAPRPRISCRTPSWRLTADAQASADERGC
jgi:hypothetical protein